LPTYTYYRQNNRKSKERILVPSDNGSRNVGEILGGIFTKFNFQSTKHICYKHNSIGLDEGAFFDYILPNSQFIVCTDNEKHITYKIRVSVFRSNAIFDDLGYGPQLFCPLKHWQVEQKSQSQSQMQFSFGGEISW
jgi:hypothetical protein